MKLTSDFIASSFSFEKNAVHLPEEYTEDIGHQQNQTDPGGEALCVGGFLNFLILGDVRDDASDHHETGGDPREEEPSAIAICIHHPLQRAPVRRDNPHHWSNQGV